METDGVEGVEEELYYYNVDIICFILYYNVLTIYYYYYNTIRKMPSGPISDTEDIINNLL